MATEGPLVYPPPEGGEPSAFLVPLAPRASTMNTTSRLEIDYNGDLITTAVSAIDFTGDGVIVTGSGTNVQVSIPGSGGSPAGPNNSVQLNVDGYLVGSSGLIFNTSTGALTVSGNVSGNFIVGNGSRLTGISGSNVTGYVPLAQYANTAGVVALANTANIALSVAGANVTGRVEQANIANTANRAAIANVAYSVSGANVVGGVSQAAYATRAVAADSIEGVNVSGTVPNAANASYATNAGAAVTANFAGSANTATLASYVTQSIQANITSVGTLQQLTVAGNITGQYVLGNAAYMTGIPNSYGNANVASYLPTYAGNITCLTISGSGAGLTNIPGPNVSGIVPSANYAANSGSAVNAVSAQTAGTVTQALQPNIAAVGTLNSLSVAGGVVALSYSGNGAALTTLNGANVSGTVANATYAGLAFAANTAVTAVNAVTAVTAGSATYALTVANAAQPNITSVGTLTSVTVTGNVTGGNLVTSGNAVVTGNITALGNISGTYILGNGAFLTGVGNIGSTYGNSNVVLLLASYGSNAISTTGNVTAGNLRTAGDISATGNVTGFNTSMVGNVTGSYFLGNGSQLTGLPATYGNSNVVTLLTGYGSNTISTTGNITAGYVFGNGSQLTGISASGYGNANVVTLLAGYGSNAISTTGNVTAGNFIGNVVGGGAGTPTISSATNLDLSAASAVRVIGGGTLRLPNLSAAQIANIIASNGDMLYNTTVNKLQAYENGAWANII